jgi:hypothetical protein
MVVTRMRRSAKIHVSFVLKLITMWCPLVIAMSEARNKRLVQLYSKSKTTTRLGLGYFVSILVDSGSVLD